MVKNIKGYQIDARLVDEPVNLPDEIHQKIDAFWNKVMEEKPNMWNGGLMCVSEFQKTANTISIVCRKSNYAHYLYDERHLHDPIDGLEGSLACSSLVGACLVETSDGYYVVGELAPKTSMPGCLQISGGSVDSDDIDEDGTINIMHSVIRECQEEINIDLQDPTMVKSFQMQYINLPDKAHQYMFIAKAKLTITKEQMEAHYAAYEKYLRENDLEIEFKRIHLIPKGKLQEYLEKAKY